MAGKRVTAGKVSPVEESRAGVDLSANAQLEACQAAAELEGARQELAAVIGDAEPQFSEVEAASPGLPTRPSIAQLLGQLDLAPALQASRVEIERRRALVDVERTRAPRRDTECRRQTRQRPRAHAGGGRPFGSPAAGGQERRRDLRGDQARRESQRRIRRDALAPRFGNCNTPRTDWPSQGRPPRPCNPPSCRLL